MGEISMKRETELYDFKAFGAAIKAARKAKGIFYELVTFLEVSVDQFFFPNAEVDKSTQRRQLDTMLDEMGSKELTIMTATARGIQEAGQEEE